MIDSGGPDGLDCLRSLMLQIPLRSLMLDSR